MGSSKAGAWGREFPSGGPREGQDDRYATGPGGRPHWSDFFVKNGIGKLSAVFEHTVKVLEVCQKFEKKKNGKRY